MGNRKTEEVWSREMGLSRYMMLKWARSSQSFPWPDHTGTSAASMPFSQCVKQSENQHCLPELNHSTTELSPLTLCPLQFIMVLLLFTSFLCTTVQVNNTFLRMFLLQEDDCAARKPSSSGSGVLGSFSSRLWGNCIQEPAPSLHSHSCPRCSSGHAKAILHTRVGSLCPLALASLSIAGGFGYINTLVYRGRWKQGFRTGITEALTWRIFVPGVVLRRCLGLRDLNLLGEKFYPDAQTGGYVGTCSWASADWSSYSQEWWGQASLGQRWVGYLVCGTIKGENILEEEMVEGKGEEEFESPTT